MVSTAQVMVRPGLPARQAATLRVKRPGAPQLHEFANVYRSLHFCYAMSPIRWPILVGTSRASAELALGVRGGHYGAHEGRALNCLEGDARTHHALTAGGTNSGLLMRGIRPELELNKLRQLGVTRRAKEAWVGHATESPRVGTEPTLGHQA